MELTEFERVSLIAVRDELKEFTKECRPSMHKPDEQGISARVVGSMLDNAMGTSITERGVALGFQELIVVLKDEEKAEPLKVNLADLIALARMAVVIS